MASGSPETTTQEKEVSPHKVLAAVPDSEDTEFPNRTTVCDGREKPAVVVSGPCGEHWSSCVTSERYSGGLE